MLQSTKEKASIEINKLQHQLQCVESIMSREANGLPMLSVYVAATEERGNRVMHSDVHQRLLH